MKRIFDIQRRLTVAKTEKGERYMYRTLPATLQALCPMLSERGLAMMLPCRLIQGVNGNYVVADCDIYDVESGARIATTSYVTKDENAMIRGGQGTGAAATYARKGAIDGMFLLDVNNPEVLDLDDYEGLRRAADRNEDGRARELEQRAKVVVGLIEQAQSVDELKQIANANRDVMTDGRVKKAGKKRQEELTGKAAPSNQ